MSPSKSFAASKRSLTETTVIKQSVVQLVRKFFNLGIGSGVISNRFFAIRSIRHLTIKMCFVEKSVSMIIFPVVNGVSDVGVVLNQVCTAQCGKTLTILKNRQLSKTDEIHLKRLKMVHFSEPFLPKLGQFGTFLGR